MQNSTSRAVFDDRLARAYQQAIALRAEAENIEPPAFAATPPLSEDDDLPMQRLARRLALGREQTDLLWTIVACSIDGRLTNQLEPLGGPHARHGLSLALYSLLAGDDDTNIPALAQWLSAPNPLVDAGLLEVIDSASPAARGYVAAARLVSYLAGDDVVTPPLRIRPPPACPLHDREQASTVAALAEVLRAGLQSVVVIGGAVGSGRASAAACAVGESVLVLDTARIAPSHFSQALRALRGECELRDELVVLANVDQIAGDDADERRRLVGETIDTIDGPVIVTTTGIGIGIDTIKPVVRFAWGAGDTNVRAALWRRAVLATGRSLDCDLWPLAHRYPVGPGAIERAVASMAVARASRAPVDEAALAAGLRANIAEQLGGLAQRIEITQSWEDLVLGDDTRHPIAALIGRVRHAPQVLDRWGYRKKIARGAGVAALFSGPPGTGKTMVAGLIARELDLELYQVDLSKVVSKWVGETEKNLARIFDGAEQGHALLLFDEADSLFGQRSAVTGANDRYANLEVNYLLQRVEAFGGITILTTNMESAIDAALKRRLAAHIVFASPDEDERALLWQRMTSTGRSPLASSVDHAELASRFPAMTGANIKNAAIAGAFLAAAEAAREITHDHFVRAARGEYRSMGHMVSEVVAPRSRFQGRS